jgi:hypothetical protein
MPWDSRALCCIRALLSAFSVVEVHLGPLCSPKFRIGRATESSVTLSQGLTNALVNSGALALDDLSIVAAESAWVIYADIVCLNHDGNLHDACLLALVQSLHNMRIPETEGAEEESLNTARNGTRASDPEESGAAPTEVFISDTNFRRLKLRHLLTSTTFAVLDQQLLADPTAAEEELAAAHLTGPRAGAQGGRCPAIRCTTADVHRRREDACIRAAADDQVSDATAALALLSHADYHTSPLTVRLPPLFAVPLAIAWMVH